MVAFTIINISHLSSIHSFTVKDFWYGNISLSCAVCVLHLKANEHEPIMKNRGRLCSFKRETFGIYLCMWMDVNIHNTHTYQLVLSMVFTYCLFRIISRFLNVRVESHGLWFEIKWIKVHKWKSAFEHRWYIYVHTHTECRFHLFAMVPLYFGTSPLQYNLCMFALELQFSVRVLFEFFYRHRVVSWSYSKIIHWLIHFHFSLAIWPSFYVLTWWYAYIDSNIVTHSRHSFTFTFISKIKCADREHLHMKSTLIQTYSHSIWTST